jgi:methylmalonyl-CoA epimerase
MIQRIHHVAAVVRDLERAYTLWRDALGLPVLHEAEIPDQGVRAALLAAGPCEIELLEPMAADTGVARFLEKRGEALHHLCFQSDDVGRDLKRFAATEVALIDKKPRQGLAGLVGFVHPRSCAGVLVELVTPSEPLSLPETAVSVATVHLAVDDVQSAVELYQNLFGLVGTGAHSETVVQLTSGDVIVQLASTERTHWPAGLAALGLSVADLAGAAERLGRHGASPTVIPGGLVVAPPAGGGVPLVLRRPGAPR